MIYVCLFVDTRQLLVVLQVQVQHQRKAPKMSKPYDYGKLVSDMIKVLNHQRLEYESSKRHAVDGLDRMVLSARMGVPMLSSTTFYSVVRQANDWLRETRPGWKISYASHYRIWRLTGQAEDRMNILQQKRGDLKTRAASLQNELEEYVSLMNPKSSEYVRFEAARLTASRLVEDITRLVRTI